MKVRFLPPVLKLTAIISVLMVYPLFAWIPELKNEVIAAGFIAMFNGIVGLMIIELTIDKPNSVFMASFLGGTGLRVIVILFVFALLLTEGFDAVGLTFFMMGFYFAYLILEIRFLVKTMSDKRNQFSSKAARNQLRESGRRRY